MKRNENHNRYDESKSIFFAMQEVKPSIREHLGALRAAVFEDSIWPDKIWPNYRKRISYLNLQRQAQEIQTLAKQDNVIEDVQLISLTHLVVGEIIKLLHPESGDYEKGKLLFNLFYDVTSGYRSDRLNLLEDREKSAILERLSNLHLVTDYQMYGLPLATAWKRS